MYYFLHILVFVTEIQCQKKQAEYKAYSLHYTSVNIVLHLPLLQ